MYPFSPADFKIFLFITDFEQFDYAVLGVVFFFLVIQLYWTFWVSDSNIKSGLVFVILGASQNQSLA